MTGSASPPLAPLAAPVAVAEPVPAAPAARPVVVVAVHHLPAALAAVPLAAVVPAAVVPATVVPAAVVPATVALAAAVPAAVVPAAVALAAVPLLAAVRGAGLVVPAPVAPPVAPLPITLLPATVRAATALGLAVPARLGGLLRTERELAVPGRATAVLPLGGATGLRARTGPVSLRPARCRGCFLRRHRCVPGVAQSGLSRCV